MGAVTTIVLLLNGVQVYLDKPALLIADHAYVPVRAVCERVNVTVIPELHRQRVCVRDHGTTHYFRITAGPQQAGNDATAVHIGDTVYVSATDLAATLDGFCKWLPGQRGIDLHLPCRWRRLSTSVQAMLSSPFKFTNRTVTVVGRYVGPGNCFDAGCEGRVRPTRVGFWVRDGGQIYCSTQEMDTSPPLPLHDTGRLLKITGRVSIDDNGYTNLGAATIEEINDTPYPILWVKPERYEYANSDTICLTAAIGYRSGRIDSPCNLPARFTLRINAPNGRTYKVSLESVADMENIATTETPDSVAIVPIAWEPPLRGYSARGHWRVILTAADAWVPAVTAFRVKTE